MLWKVLSTSRRNVLAIVIVLLLCLGVTVPTAQAQLSLQVSIEDATFEQGAIRVTGIVTCSEPTGDTNVNVEVRQPIGQKKSQVGSEYDPLGPCPDVIPFSVLVVPFAGQFKAGKTIFVFADVDGCNADFSSCDSDSDSQAIDVSK